MSRKIKSDNKKKTSLPEVPVLDPLMNLVPGEPYISDEGTVYISAQTFGEIHHRSGQQVKIHLSKRRIPGAVKVGSRKTWMIPCDAEYPPFRKDKTKLAD